MTMPRVVWVAPAVGSHGDGLILSSPDGARFGYKNIEEVPYLNADQLRSEVEKMRAEAELSAAAGGFDDTSHYYRAQINAFKEVLALIANAREGASLDSADDARGDRA